MATMAEMEDKMTLFYSKSTGQIKSFCTGIQDMSYFGIDEEDYSIIWDFIIVKLDNFLVNNYQNFVVEEGVVKIRKDNMGVPDYPISNN